MRRRRKRRTSTKRRRTGSELQCSLTQQSNIVILVHGPWKLFPVNEEEQEKEEEEEKARTRMSITRRMRSELHCGIL